MAMALVFFCFFSVLSSALKQLNSSSKPSCCSCWLLGAIRKKFPLFINYAICLLNWRPVMAWGRSDWGCSAQTDMNMKWISNRKMNTYLKRRFWKREAHLEDDHKMDEVHRACKILWKKQTQFVLAGIKGSQILEIFDKHFQPFPLHVLTPSVGIWSTLHTLAYSEGHLGLKETIHSWFIAKYWKNLSLQLPNFISILKCFLRSIIWENERLGGCVCSIFPNHIWPSQVCNQLISLCCLRTLI